MTSGSAPPPVTIISVTNVTSSDRVSPPHHVTNTSSRDSLEQDSGNPESELTGTASERGNSRSPSDYRSLDCDSLSVDCDSGEGVSDHGGDSDQRAHGATVIHVSGDIDSIPNIDDDDDDLNNRKTLQTEVTTVPLSANITYPDLFSYNGAYISLDKL